MSMLERVRSRLWSSLRLIWEYNKEVEIGHITGIQGEVVALAISLQG